MQFTATVSAMLTFTREEVEYLALCAERHYDYSIKALVPPGEGAIINGMRTQLLHPSADSISDPYTFRQMDMLHKAIEFEDDLIARRLKRQFAAACHKINELTLALNKLMDVLTDISLSKF